VGAASASCGGEECAPFPPNELIFRRRRARIAPTV